MTVRIGTDSASDLTPGEAEALGVDIVPLSIRCGEEVFLDREELDVEEFYRRMASSEDLPQTAAPAPGAFQEVFRRHFAEGADAIVCVNLWVSYFESRWWALLETATGFALLLLFGAGMYIGPAASCLAGIVRTFEGDMGP